MAWSLSLVLSLTHFVIMGKFLNLQFLHEGVIMDYVSNTCRMLATVLGPKKEFNKCLFLFISSSHGTPLYTSIIEFIILC